jgi:hypothetical protein
MAHRYPSLAVGAGKKILHDILSLGCVSNIYCGLRMEAPIKKHLVEIVNSSNEKNAIIGLHYMETDPTGFKVNSINQPLC